MQNNHLSLHSLLFSKAPKYTMKEQLQRDFHRLAEDILCDLHATHKNIIGAYIGGSYATGTLTPGSDLDLTVVSNSDALKRSFRYYGHIPVDLNIYPRKWCSRTGLEQVEPTIWMGLYYGIILSDSQGILRTARDYLERHLFGPKHQEVWVRKALQSARKRLDDVRIAIEKEDWIYTQIQLHKCVLKLGEALGYLSRIPPNIVMNLIKLSEACEKIGKPHIPEVCSQVYSLPSTIPHVQLERFQEQVSEIYERISNKVIACGKGQEEREKASLFSPDRPNRWDYIERKLDRLSERSCEHSYSAIVWATEDLHRMGKQWMSELDESYQWILDSRKTILSLVGLNRTVASQRLESLSKVIDEVRNILETGDTETSE